MAGHVMSMQSTAAAAPLTASHRQPRDVTLPSSSPTLLTWHRLRLFSGSRSIRNNSGCSSSSRNPFLGQPHADAAVARKSGCRCHGHDLVAAAAAGASPIVAASAAAGAASTQQQQLKAVVFDCDGVILESEDLHRRAYNAAFEHFGVRCPGEGSSKGPLLWTSEFYDQLQNKIGGGKPKMRWYFNKNGWPHSSLFPQPPTTDSDRDLLIDTLQDWKTEKYQRLIGSGEVPPRPGVLELMDQARAQGLLLAVCSAATKSSVVFTLTSLLGKSRFERLDCFLAGDDVDKKKPDPTIYKKACERLGVHPSSCIVVEDSVIGLKAALGADMACIITHTPSTKDQDFTGATAVYESLAGVTVRELEELVARIGKPAFQSI